MIARCYLFMIMTILLQFCYGEEMLCQVSATKPELMVFSISFKEEVAKAKGYSYTVNFTVQNFGKVGVATSDRFYVKFFLTTADKSLLSYSVYLGEELYSVSLKSMEYAVLSKRITIPDTLSLEETKDFYLTVLVDAYNNIDEADVYDNLGSSSSRYAITEPPSGVDLTGEDLSFEESYYRYKGNSYEINYAIWNHGNIDLLQGSNPKIRFYLSLNNLISPLDIPIADIVLDDMIPKRSGLENLQTRVTIPEGMEAGGYYLGMLIDRDDEIDETVKTNNSILSASKYFVVEKGSVLPYFVHSNETGAGSDFSVTNATLLRDNISTGDEIGIYDGSMCVGAGVVTGIWPLKIRAWRDNPQTGGKDGYESGNAATYYYWDFSRMMEYILRADYLRGDGIFNAGTSPELWLTDTGTILMNDGEKIMITVANDTSFISAAFRSGEGVSIRFNSGGTKGRVLSITQSTRPFDEIASSQRFSNPIYYVRPEIGIQDYEAEICFEYTDACMLEKGIQENNLSIAAWNADIGSWEEIPSLPDTAKNTIIATVTDFSIFALISSTETLITGIEYQNDDIVPNRFYLHPNYPNPFNPATTIRYELARPSDVTIKVFNMLGQEVRTLVASYLAGGAHEAVWDGMDNRGRPVSSGIYICRMITGEGFAETRKMALIR